MRDLTPPQVLVLGFAALIVVGTVLLLLPFASTRGISPVDALFTATSAVCVTGLTVVDTGRDLSPLGQGVVLALIQLGGLGIMTCSAVLLLVVGRGPSFRARLIIQDLFSPELREDVLRLLRAVVCLALGFELTGALLLWASRPASSPFEAAFHAVSAFCNAGFCLWRDSFAWERPAFLLVAAGLIVAGGIGFFVLVDLAHRALLRHHRPLTLHTKLVLSTTALLLAGGTFGFLALEWDGVLASLSVPLRFLHAFFQAVTCRTAGFSTLPMDALRPPTLIMLSGLMFIGASPGSCGGGIKTTTFALLCLGLRARLRGWGKARAFRRGIAPAAVDRAMAVFLLSLGTVTAATFVLLCLQPLPPLAAWFEVISAFGTVGLSTGVTPGLAAGGKLLLAAVMFAGRLGPLTLAYSMAHPVEAEEMEYAEENVMVG